MIYYPEREVMIMPFILIRNDITRLKTDAIVNAANSSLLGGGGVDGAIHRAAGPELKEECRKLHGCHTGEAKITGGYRLPAKYVIHTVGPVWNGGCSGEKELLISCYRNSLKLAAENGCESVAFPLISAGVYGYPKDQALRIAADTIREFLQDHEMQVYLILYDRGSMAVSRRLYADIKEYIDDRYAESHTDASAEARRKKPFAAAGRSDDLLPSGKHSLLFHQKSELKADILPESEEAREEAVTVQPALHPDAMAISAAGHASLQPQNHEISEAYAAKQPQSLEEALKMRDESFSEMLLRKIDEKGLTDAACYKKANIDRKLFSKIRSDVHYRPSKATALAFALALELPLEETRELLLKAGYALSPSYTFDMIVEYFIRKGIYDVYQVNEALFDFDQPLLGNIAAEKQ